ncbi:MAG: hypothetical protein AABZ47_04500 [Planctomycetota bacterium]
MKRKIRGSRSRGLGGATVAAVCISMVTAIGGCRPEFRNVIVDAQNVVVDAFETGVRGVVNAALDIVFAGVRPLQAP